MVEESENPVKEDTPIKLNRISSQNLSKIIEYCKYYYKLPPFPNDEQWKEKAKRSEIKGHFLSIISMILKSLEFSIIRNQCLELYDFIPTLLMMSFLSLL